MANVYRWALQTDKAMPLYEKYIREHSPENSSPYYCLSWLMRLQGDHDKAIQVLESYVRKDPSSLATCDVLLEISWIELKRGHLEAAVKAFDRADAIDDWKGSVINHAALLDWIRGDRKGCIAELKRSAQRYPSPSTYAQVGWAQLAEGDVQGAAESDKQALQTNADPSGYALADAILFRQGQAKEAEMALAPLESRMIHDESPQRLLALHFYRLGDYPQAVAHAEKAMARSRSYNLQTLLPVVCEIYIAAGDFSKAERIAKALHALNPVGLRYDCLTARMALAQGDPNAAVQALDRAVKEREADALGLLAKAQLALVKSEQSHTGAGGASNVDLLSEAYVNARDANATNIYPDTEWLYVQAEAASALGKTNEARALWKQCLDLEGPVTQLGKQAAQRLAEK